jgi:CheY-like chemotaxis protein
MVPTLILLVDDDPTNRYTSAKILMEAGYKVVSAANYVDALKLLDDPSSVSLLLTDILMPEGVNGFALARMARMRRHDLKIIYMTAYDVPHDEAIGPILQKPVEPAELVAAVGAALTG